jgi:hypothetical protein
MSDKQSNTGEEKESCLMERDSADMEEEVRKGRKRKTLGSKKMKKRKKIKRMMDSEEVEEDVGNRKGSKVWKKKTKTVKALKKKKEDIVIDSDTSWSASDDEGNGAEPKLSLSKSNRTEKIIRTEGKAGKEDSSENGSGKSGGIIKDEEVEGVLKKHYKHNVGIWPGGVDLSPKEEEYCCEKQRQCNPELHPPFLFTGENCRPTRMAELLMGEDCRQFEGGKTVWMKKAYHMIGRVNRYQEISESLKKHFKVNGNIELFHIKGDKNPAGAAKVRWQAKKYVTYFCETCYIRSKMNELNAVVRAELKEERKGENVRCYFDILECFFHSCTLYNLDGEEILENSEAVILQVEGSVFMDEVRKCALDEWVKDLPKYKESEGDGPVTRITLNSKEPQDVRYQWRIQNPSDVPLSIDSGKLAQLLSWDLWRILKERNMVEGFTRHIPVSYAVKRKGGKVKAGFWTLKNGMMKPIHLYMRGCYLMWGGYSLDGKGHSAEQVVLDQEPHSEYANTGFSSAEECVLLNGLAHPCTFNSPIEDYCEFYTCRRRNTNDRKDWKVNMNEILVLHADTMHGGKAYKHKGCLHPSRHGAVESLRYPRKEGTDAVVLSVGPQTYMPSKFIVSMTDQGVDEAVQKLVFCDLKPLVENIFESERVTRGKTLELAKKLKQVFFGDKEEEYYYGAEEDIKNGVVKGIMDSASESGSD